jgi:hypothetical protein
MEKKEEKREKRFDHQKFSKIGSGSSRVGRVGALVSRQNFSQWVLLGLVWAVSQSVLVPKQERRAPVKRSIVSKEMVDENKKEQQQERGR